MYRLHLFDKQASTHSCPTKWLKSTLCLHAFQPTWRHFTTPFALLPTCPHLLPLISPLPHSRLPSLTTTLLACSSSSVPHPNSPTPSPALTLSLLLLPPQPHSPSLPLALVTPVWVPNIPVLLIRSRPLIPSHTILCTFSTLYSLPSTHHPAPSLPPGLSRYCLSSPHLVHPRYSHPNTALHLLLHTTPLALNPHATLRPATTPHPAHTQTPSTQQPATRPADHRPLSATHTPPSANIPAIGSTHRPKSCPFVTACTSPP